MAEVQEMTEVKNPETMYEEAAAELIDLLEKTEPVRIEEPEI